MPAIKALRGASLDITQLCVACVDVLVSCSRMIQVAPHERPVRKRRSRTVGSGRSSAASATSAAACSNSASSCCVWHPSARGAVAVSAMATCNGGNEHAWHPRRRNALRTSCAQL